MIVANLKSDTLYSELWEELTKLSPGERFLSVREIMKRYGVSQLTVDKAVSKLRDDGYLHQVTGKGLFASEQVARFSREVLPTYLLAVPQWLSTDIDVLEQTVAEIRKNFPDNRLLIHKFNPAEAIPAQLPLMEENVVGLVLLPSASNLELNDLAVITSYARPVVVLGRHLDTFGLPSVGTDDIFAGHMAAHYLFEHGHRKLGLLLSEPHNRTIMERVKGVMDYAELHKMDVQMIDCEVRNGEVAVDKAYRRFQQVLAGGFEFTALVGVSGDSMQGAVNACLNCGIAIPQRLSMVAMAMESLTETFHPPLTTIAIHFDAQVRMALDILSEKIDLEANACYIRPSIIERNSVRPL